MAGFQQREGVRAQQVAKLNRHAFGRRRGVRQRQAVERQRDRTERRQREDAGGIRDTGHPDADPGDNPADGAEHADHREGFIDIGRLLWKAILLVSARVGI